MSHVTHTDESRRTNEWVTLRIRMSHVTQLTSLCHRWTSRVTAVGLLWCGLPAVAILRCVTWLIHVCDLTHSCVWRDSFICVTWRIYESWCGLSCGGHSEVCDMTHSRVWHDSFMCVTWLIHMCDMTHSWVMMWAALCWPFWGVWHDLFTCVSWLTHVCDMTRWYVRHNLCMCVTWLSLVCGVTHSCVRRDSWISETRLVHVCDIT